MFEACTPATNKQTNTSQTEPANGQTESKQQSLPLFPHCSRPKGPEPAPLSLQMSMQLFLHSQVPASRTCTGRETAFAEVRSLRFSKRTNGPPPTKQTGRPKQLSRQRSLQLSLQRSLRLTLSLLAAGPGIPNLHRKEAAFRTCAVVQSAALIRALLISSVGCFGTRRTPQSYPASAADRRPRFRP